MGLAEMFRKKSKEPEEILNDVESEEDVTSEEDVVKSEEDVTEENELICPYCSKQIKFDEDDKPKFDEYPYGHDDQISIFVCPYCKKILGFASNPEY